MITYFDAIHYKIPPKGRIQTRAVYTYFGIDANGPLGLLVIWMADSKGTHFWLLVLTELQNRGVQDILITWVDSLKGFPKDI